MSRKSKGKAPAPTADPDHQAGSQRDQTPRRLLLMRHAKAAYPDECSDHQRPLAGRGRNDAPEVGKWLAGVGWTPEVVVCSDAARTVETANLVIDGLGSDVNLRPESDLYEAGIGTVLDVIARTDDSVRTLLIVGHEPTMSATTGAICGKFAHFPTATVAQIDLEGPWDGIQPGSGRLVAVRAPRD